jgi:hypothetical protein
MFNVYGIFNWWLLPQLSGIQALDTNLLGSVTEYGARSAEVPILVMSVDLIDNHTVPTHFGKVMNTQVSDMTKTRKLGLFLQWSATITYHLVTFAITFSRVSAFARSNSFNYEMIYGSDCPTFTLSK